jgi:dTDP-D-glucose 4,6-dehydratase
MSFDHPRILVLGACGFVGRNFIHFVVENKLASFIKAVDKAIPSMSYFHPLFERSFQAPEVQFEQADLTK